MTAGQHARRIGGARRRAAPVDERSETPQGARAKARANQGRRLRSRRVQDARGEPRGGFDFGVRRLVIRHRDENSSSGRSYG